MSALVLTGSDLTPEAVRRVARDGQAVAVSEAARTRMATCRAVVERHLADNRPVYGLTTGLGARVVHRLPAEALAEFSRLTILGRSHAVGPPLPRDAVRAIMLARLNGLLLGGAGASPAVADALVCALNHGLHPVVPQSGSIGAGDLCLLAPIGLALIGEGEMEVDGAVAPAAEALARAGLAPLELGPKDGLALCNASSASAGVGALALADARAVYEVLTLSAALSLEGFRANLTPLDPRVIAARPQPGQEHSARLLLGYLRGGGLTEAGAARRLQDPISLRCVSPVHGALHAALDFAEQTLAPELNGDSSNPVVLPEHDDILSTANFQTPLLAVAFDAASQALAQCTHLAVARISKLLVERLTDLPANLTRLGPTRSGFAPLLKPAEALLAEIEHLAMPVRGGLSLSADGVEDHMTHAPQAVHKLGEAVQRLRLIAAIELIVAAQAVELRGVERLGAATAATFAAVRRHVPALDEDRPLGAAINAVDASLLANDVLLAEIRAALQA